MAPTRRVFSADEAGRLCSADSNLSPAEIPQRLMRQLFELDADPPAA